MSRISTTGITSSAGLITGIPIQDTVDQLMAIASRPRSLLASRNQGLTAERTAIDRLSSLTLSTKFSLSRLNLSRTFTARTATSSGDSVKATVKTGASPAAGSYQFTPLKQATAHQLVSSRIDDISSLGTGSLSLRFGGHVDKGVSLADLNGGEGVAAGQIKITDSAGDTAVIDLRGARNVDDVLEAINNAAEIDVTASVDGDRLVLTDNTGESGAFRVREVNNGTTAASLGLLGAASSGKITGSDVYTLSAGSSLASLRDGLGVRFTDTADKASTTELNESADLSITLADGTTKAAIDLSGSKTLGDVIDRINSSDDLGGKLTASINAASNGLVLTDTSGGGGDLLVADAGGATAATDLGIATKAGAGTTVEGARLISGLKDTLVSTLNAGAGFTLGSIDVTDRAGVATTIDLSGAETLQEIAAKINADAQSAGVQLTASINSSRNGLAITDTSGGSGSLIIANNGAGTTANDLGIASNSAATSVNSGSLNRQTASTATLLSTLNGGAGVRIGDIRITDSSGKTSTIDLQKTDNDAKTLGDVIDRINAAAVNVTASLNSAGDGILLTDNAGGTGVLKVLESGSGKAAADLGLLGDSTTKNNEGQQTIDGTSSYSVDLAGLENSATATSLASLKEGKGVNKGDPAMFKITTSTDQTFFVDLGLAKADAQTIGDVIDRINEAATVAGQDVTASLNEKQTGILITDNTGGAGKLTVSDFDSSTTAADLNLIRTAADTKDGEIDGAGLFTFDGSNALKTLANRINELGAGVTAGIFNDGTGFRLSLTSDRTGAGNELLVDGLASSLGFEVTSRASDAVALFGGIGGLSGFAVTSTTNEFSDVIEGVSLSVAKVTGDPVTISVAANDAPVTDAVKGFIDAYNSLRSNLDTVASFDAENLTTGILFGRSEVVRVDSDLSRLLTDRYFIDGQATSLEQIGVSVDDKGKLSLDSAKLSQALNDSPEIVDGLFRDPDRGVVAKFNTAIDRLAGGDNSLLSSRSSAIGRTIESNEQRLESFDQTLDRQRERLLLDFYNLEQSISQLQSNTSFLDSIVPVSIA